MVPSGLSWPRTDVYFIPAETPSHRPCSYLHFHVPLRQLCNIHKFVQCLISCLFHLTFSAISWQHTSYGRMVCFVSSIVHWNFPGLILILWKKFTHGQPSTCRWKYVAVIIVETTVWLFFSIHKVQFNNGLEILIFPNLLTHWHWFDLKYFIGK
jgi:hypothetical protein